MVGGTERLLPAAPWDWRLAQTNSFIILTLIVMHLEMIRSIVRTGPVSSWDTVINRNFSLIP